MIQNNTEKYSRSRFSWIDNLPQVSHNQNLMVQSNIDIGITSNIPIMFSLLKSSYVSEKQITLKEIDQIQQVFKNHLADHYMLNQEAIDTMGIKIKVQPSKLTLHLPSKILVHL